MMRLFSVSAALLCFAGCDSSRDFQDKELEVRLDMRLAELEMLAAEPAEWRAVQLELKETLARMKPISEAELAASAGPAAKIEWTLEAFFARAIVSSPGTRQEAMAFVTQVLARGPGQRLATLKLTTTGWSATFLVILEPPVKARQPDSEPLGPRPTFCMASCRELRDRVTQKQARAALLAEKLGDLTDFFALRTEVRDRMRVASKLSAPEWREVLPRLAQAPSFGPGAELNLSQEDGQITGVPELHRESLRQLCELEPRLLDRCVWKGDQLELHLVAKP